MWYKATLNIFINYNYKSISKEKRLRIEKDSQLFISLGKNPIG